MRLQQALIASTALVAGVTLPLLSRAGVNAYWEWSRAGGGSSEWFRNSGPVVVAEFPGGRLPSMYPRVHLLLPGLAPTSVRWRVADPSRLQLSDANREAPIAVSESIPFEKYVVPGRVTGPSEIIAKVGPPHSEALKIPTYTYPVLSVGCGFGSSGEYHLIRMDSRAQFLWLTVISMKLDHRATRTFLRSIGVRQVSTLA